MHLQPLFDRLFTSVDVIKDSSLIWVRTLSLLLGFGHPIFFFLWTSLYPQPYESIWLRSTASLCGFILLALSFKLDINSPMLITAYGITCFMGAAMAGTWLFVANFANPVWLASYCILILVYCSMTDLRIAVLGIIVAMLITRIALPIAEPNIWLRESFAVFSGPVLLVVTFTFVMAAVLHANDLTAKNMVQLSQRRALGTAAHEVRTPLAGVSLLSDALQEITENLETDKPLKKDTLNFIKELANNISNSVQTTQLIIATQLANSDPQTAFSHRVPVNIGAIATRAIQDFSLGDSSRTGTVRLIVQNEFHVHGDEVVLKQVLVNLLENAITAVVLRSRKPYPGCIEVNIGDDDANHVLLVRDEGIGISKFEIARIFKPFYTRHGDKGHGLGLTFVKSAINAYNGTIKVTSTVGHGSTFTITFPKKPLS